MLPDKKALQVYREIEKSLKSLFKLFDDLCLHCFTESIEYLKSGGRENYEELCCCVTDDQVHDHWLYLNPVQRTTEGLQWAKKLDKERLDIGRRRLPGNGPCPALSESGCIIKCYRPPTCSTQLCKKMVAIIKELNLFDKLPKFVPCQIEDLMGTESPMNLLYGIKKGKPSEKEVMSFIDAITRLTQKMLAVKVEVRKAAIERQKLSLSSKLAGRRK